MKHIQEYTTERKRVSLKIHKDYSTENDDYLREVVCVKKLSRYIMEDRAYRLYAEFDTGAMISGKCYVILTDNNEFIGIDSEYFLEKYQWEAIKKYNL
jgi:hypothetical protein